MAACALCGATMAVNERNANKAGTAMALHNDCAHREEMQRLATAGVGWDKSEQLAIADDIARLTKRRAGIPTTWP